MCDTPLWGWFTFGRGSEFPQKLNVKEEASKSQFHLDAVLNRLQHDGSEEAIELGLELIDLYG